MPKTTRRTTQSSTPGSVPMFDLGGRTVPKGATVRVAAAPRPTMPTETDPGFSGTLTGVDYRDGVAFTVTVWTEHGSRSVYAERVAV